MCDELLSLLLSRFSVGSLTVKPWVWSLNLFYLEFAELLGCVDACFSPTMDSLGPLFLQIFFLLLFFLLLRLPVFACLALSHRPLWLPSLFFILF